jgi:hypothetical protein
MAPCPADLRGISRSAGPKRRNEMRGMECASFNAAMIRFLYELLGRWRSRRRPPRRRRYVKLPFYY